MAEPAITIREVAINLARAVAEAADDRPLVVLQDFQPAI